MFLTRLRTLVGRAPGARATLRAARRFSGPFRRNTRFWDGTGRKTDGELAQLFRAWRRSDAQRHESDEVFGAYSGGDVIDVGSYEAWYAALLAPKARVGDRFLLLEPDPRALPKLHRIAAELARLFPHVGFFVLPVAAGNGGPVQMTFPYGEEGHPRVESGDGEGRTRTVRIDDLVTTLSLRPALIKIDVEGAEWNVMEGAERTLAAGEADLMLEVHPKWLPAGVAPADVHGLLERFGYVRHDIEVSGDVAWRELWRPRK
jgi:FkbM family methyltransferase